MSAAPRQLLPIATAARTRAAVRELLRGHGGLTAATAAVMTLAALAVVLVPPLLGRVVDVVVEGPDGADDGRASLRLLALLLLGALLARAAFEGVGVVLTARLGETVLARLRERVVERALRLPIGVVERAGSGDLVQRTGGDVAVISQAIREAVPLLVLCTLDVALTVAGLAVLDWRLALAGLAPLPLWVLATRWYLRASGPRYAAERVADGVATGSLVDTLGGSATIRALRLQRRHHARLARTSADALTASMRTRTMQARFGYLLNAAEGLGVLSLLAAGFWLVRADAVTIGAATAAVLYFLRLFSPLMQLLYLLDEAQSAGAALARLVGVVDVPLDPTPTGGAVPRDAALAVRGLRHAYGDDEEVLHGVDLDLAPGERVAVVGASGAGKTTLGTLVAGVRRPTDGEVRIGGVPLDDLPDLRRHVVLVTQEVHVFAGTVADNLRLARPGATDAELRTALDRLGVGLALDGDVADIHTEVGATQAQLLALARLLLADPAVAVLDEATAEAGSAGARTLEAAAETALAGRTALVIAHRLTQAVAADRVVVLDRGRVVEQGPHDELVAAGGPYAALWASWRGARTTG
ncbi:ABC transporter ATP-binding protein [Nocardioides marinquilinus]|uniref:ABC transporter ATP-binding protein n=1 Tax=Nocardioides marinquilinus TaxID=1210400 RepID=A0ABP9PF12_9ACTN